ncbi:hypothetical protein HOD96_00520 [Candidatus Falkowbacteria bacterium]|jgi:hypothetical protein|nr:hypothetical protein [Candidatus Falkowbacteria bacterium]MBT4433278.1 hypothetical protein [Candidatus Falkowbacteria bacterium]
MKKLFTIAVVFATVCWSMGIASIMPAMAATISAGDLIKASSAAVYYYGSDGQRYVFPTESTYMSWYGDFSGVQTITDAELAAIDIGGNVTVRPGTKLVKIDTDPKTYAVTPGGVLKHIDSEARAIALYGADWATRVIDINESFWVNYTKGTAVDSDVHPDGALVKYDGSDTVYYIEGGVKRAVSDDGMTTNNLRAEFAVTTAVTYSDGAGLTEEETTITNVSGGSSSSAGTGLTVALAADTPSSGIVVGGAARYAFTKVNLTAGADGDVTVDTLVVQRTGLANDNAFTSIDIIDGTTGLPINTTSKSLNSQHQATFTKDFTVAAGTTKSVILAANMASSLASYAGETPILTLADLTLGGGAAVTGDLPISGNYQTTNGTISIGSATVSRGAYGNATSTSIKVGQEDYTFFSFKVVAGSAEMVSFSQVKVYQGGSATLGTDLTGIELFQDGTKLADGTTDGKYVSFDFDAVTLDKGATGQFLVKADVVEGSARTVDMGIYKATDLIVTGLSYGYNITPTYTSTGSSANSPVLSDNLFTVSTGTLTVSKSNTIGATDISVADDQIVGAFQFTVKGEPIDITAVTMTLSSTTVGSSNMTNVELIDANGNTVAGPTDPSSGTVSFSDTFTAPVGDNVYRVRVDLESNAGWETDDTIYATITAGSGVTAEGTVTGENITASPSTAVNTNTQTVKAGSLTVTRDTLPANANIIIGASDVTLGSWTFDASDSGEDVRLTSIAIAASSSAATNLTLYADGVALEPSGQDKPSSDDDGTTTTFALSEALVITKGTQATIQLRGDIESSATATDTSQFGITCPAAITVYGKSTGDTVTPTVTADDGATLTYLASGTLTISTSSNPPAGFVMTGSTGNTMTKIRLKAKYEDLDLDKIKLFVTDGGVSSATGNYQDILSVTIYDGSTEIATHSIPSTGSYEFVITTGTITIPAGGEKILTVKAAFSEIQADTDNAPGTASADVKIGIGGASGIKTTGNESNVEITGSNETYQGSTSSAMILHESQPTVTYSTSADPMGAASSLTAGSLALFKFKVAADAGNEVLLYAVNFDITTTTGVDITAMSIKDQDGNTVSVATNATFTAGAGVYTTTFNNPDITVGDAKEAIEVPAGGVRTFTVYGTVSGADTGDYISMTMTADTGHTLGTGDAVNTARNFVWSDNVKDDGLTTNGDNATSSSQWLGGLYVDGLTSPSAYVVGYSS